MVQFTIEIDDRLYNDFLNWANVNNMSESEMGKYIINAFKNKFFIDKYGDLNDKFKSDKKGEEKVVQQKPIVIVQDIKNLESNDNKAEQLEEKPNRGRPRKTVIQSK